jgi:hypothetical protein
LSRIRSSDPWTDDSPLRRGLHRVATIVLTLGLVITSILFGRMSVPPPAGSPRLPAQVAGATRMNGDVPVGYAKTREGAIAAATDYSAVLAGPLILNPDRYRAAERVIATPSARDRIAAEGEQAMAALNDTTRAISAAARGVRVAVRYTPIAYRVTADDAGRVSVSIWGLWLVGEQGLLPPTETWSTRTVVVVWIGGDWRLADSSISPGPIPQPGQQAAQSSDLPPQLTNFEEYAHASR